MSASKTIWKIRTVKDYPQAHNHLMVGEVLEQTLAWVRVKGKTYHYGTTVGTLNDVKVGPLMTRILPWNRIELIHELDPEFDYAEATLVMPQSGQGVILRHGEHSCRVFSPHHRPC